MKVSGQLQAPAALSPQKHPGTHLIQGLVSPRAGLDVLEYREIPCRALNSGSSSPKPSHYTDNDTTDPLFKKYVNLRSDEEL